jgi:hypothetical protein
VVPAAAQRFVLRAGKVAAELPPVRKVAAAQRFEPKGKERVLALASVAVPLVALLRDSPRPAAARRFAPLA